MNLHLLEVKNCTDNVEQPRKYVGNHESKMQQQSNCCKQLCSPERKHLSQWEKHGEGFHLSHLHHSATETALLRLTKELFRTFISSLLSRCLLCYTLYLKPIFIQFLSMHRSLLKFFLFPKDFFILLFHTHTLHKRNGSSELMFFVIIVLNRLATFHTSVKNYFIKVH